MKLNPARTNQIMFQLKKMHAMHKFKQNEKGPTWNAYFKNKDFTVFIFIIKSLYYSLGAILIFEVNNSCWF